MATGTIKWVNRTKRFVCIKPDEGGKDVFIHVSTIESAHVHKLSSGKRVQYIVPEQSLPTGKWHVKRALLQNLGGVSVKNKIVIQTAPSPMEIDVELETYAEEQLDEMIRITQLATTKIDTAIQRIDRSLKEIKTALTSKNNYQ